MIRPSAYVSVMAALTCVLGATRLAYAQRCDTVSSQTSLAAYAGRPVRSVHIDPRGPDPLPLVPALLERLHVNTRDGTIRRLLLIHAGDLLDTLRVAESLRRLRQLRYLIDPGMRAVACDGGPVDLSVTTQDLWSVRPSLQVRSTSQSVALTERNILGTGREASIGIKSDVHGTFANATLRDPWFLGRDLSLALSTSGNGERGEHSVVVQRREHSIIDLVGAEARVATSAFGTSALNAHAVQPPATEGVQRLASQALVSRRVHLSSAAATHVIGGAEYERVAWEGLFETPGIGIREFAGADAGLRRRSVAYDTVTWLLPANALIDVPLSFEFDALIGVGRDRVRGAPAERADVWMGKVWLLGRRTLLVADGWASGYHADGVWLAATTRAAVTVDRAAARGIWELRAGAERWHAADPDVRILTMNDPAYRALGADARAELSGVMASLERSMHIHRLTRSYTLDGAVFGAGSGRPGASVGVLGAGLRLAPARLGRVTARLDLGVPVTWSGDVHHRPFVAIGITPWLGQDRQRDGRRVP